MEEEQWAITKHYSEGIGFCLELIKEFENFCFPAADISRVLRPRRFFREGFRRRRDWILSARCALYCVSDLNLATYTSQSDLNRRRSLSDHGSSFCKFSISLPVSYLRTIFKNTERKMYVIIRIYQHDWIEILDLSALLLLVLALRVRCYAREK